MSPELYGILLHPYELAAKSKALMDFYDSETRTRYIGFFNEFVKQLDFRPNYLQVDFPPNR